MRENENRIAIYSRKSKFTGKGESIGNQVELCREYIRTHFNNELADNIVIYEDEGFSGGNLNRPDFKKMIKAARDKQFKAIIVYRLDRISRNISDFSGLIEELARLDIAFVSIKEQFDTGTPMGRAMMYIASVFSQLERETIAERIRDNMHELAKTGRWLGGVTPTGYTSESIRSVTVDGRTKMACKLKLIPEEAEIVKTIYSLFLETDSLTLTEAELMKRRIVTKNGKYFTRFSIRAILQNPVYVMADNEAYRYFTDKEAELFSEPDAFDGEHGLLAYNRTDQEKGRSTIYLPVSEWIVCVGQHPGLIPGATWVKVQDMLERNKQKAFHKPRTNEALLTGLLHCRCGGRMYPKLSSRKTEEGKAIFAYVCKMKERSQGSVCRGRNVNGNVLDAAVIKRVKLLAGDADGFITRMEQSRCLCTGNQAEYEERLAALRQERSEAERKLVGLVDSLADLPDGAARNLVAQRIEQLNGECSAIDQRIHELSGLTIQHALSDIEFDLMRQLLSVFRESIDGMTLQQQRAAIRTVVRQVVWDGENAHIILFGSDEPIEFPTMTELLADETEELTEFADGDYESDEMSPLREDSKRDPHDPARLPQAHGRRVPL